MGNNLGSGGWGGPGGLSAPGLGNGGLGGAGWGNNGLGGAGLGNGGIGNAGWGNAGGLGGPGLGNGGLGGAGWGNPNGGCKYSYFTNDTPIKSGKYHFSNKNSNFPINKISLNSWTSSS